MFVKRVKYRLLVSNSFKIVERVSRVLWVGLRQTRFLGESCSTTRVADTTFFRRTKEKTPLSLFSREGIPSVATECLRPDLPYVQWSPRSVVLRRTEGLPCHGRSHTTRSTLPIVYKGGRVLCLLGSNHPFRPVRPQSLV